MKHIGILGGMGPEATAEFYFRIIRKFQSKGAKYDYDFPEIFIFNLPLVDVVESANKEKAKEQLVYGCKKLESAGADFIAVPCNTVNFCIDELRASVNIPVISVVEETLKVVKGKFGVIATETTIREKLYGDAFYPDKKEQRKVTKMK